MRWDRLFQDLEAEWDEAAAQELAGEVGDRTRREHALLGLHERLGPHVGNVLELTCDGIGPLSGRLLDLGVDWLLLEESRGRHEVLLRLPTVMSVVGLGARTAAPPALAGPVGRRLDLRWALRGLSRSRSPVQVVTLDRTVRFGTIDRVGGDHLELAEHPLGVPRRAEAVRQVVLIPVPALVAVRSSA